MPDLAKSKISRDTAEELAKKAGVRTFQIWNRVEQTKLSPRKPALVIRLFYEEERQKAKGRQATSTGGRNPQLIPNLDEADNKTTNEILAKKAALVIRLFYEELAQEAKANSLAKYRLCKFAEK